MENIITSRPILMCAPMVCGILDDRKEKTRRTVKDSVIGPSIQELKPIDKDILRSMCPYGQPGDLLWVRENCWAHKDTGEIFAYCATDTKLYRDNKSVKVVPSIHMPRKKCRILLEITSTDIQRLQDISEADCLAEGIVRERFIIGADCAGGHHREIMGDRYFTCDPDIDGDEGFADAYAAFRALWISLNGLDSWNANPWVWVIGFNRVALS